MKYTKPKELKERVKGVNVVMVTPFDKNEELDIEKVAALTNFLIENGIKEGSGVLIPTGSTGECFTMNTDERKKVFKKVIEIAKGKVPIIVGCNETSTRTVIELAKNAQEAGADGVMIMPPYYGPASEVQIIEFYKRISQNIDIGIMVYNNLTVSGVDIPLRTLHILADMEKIVALKDCSEDCVKFQLTARELKTKLIPINGNNELWEPLGTLSGTEGFITLAGNFAPGLALSLWKTCKNGEYAKAEQLSRKFTEYVRFQLETDKAVQVAKHIMRDIGLPGGYERSPLLPLNDEEALRVKNIKKEMEIE